MKYSILLLAILFVAFSSCKSVEKDDLSTTGVTREEVVAIAKKYGLQDSIAEGYVSPYFKPFPKEAYPGLTKEYWEGYFAHWRKFSDDEKEFHQFRRESANITSVAEYYQLIEKYPSVYQSRVKAWGGIDAYKAKKAEEINGNWHIYLDKGGAIVFIPGDSDKGTFPGKRLDKEK